jgi:hypothetical protein
VEAWAHVEPSSASEARPSVQFLVNRTPITGDVRAYIEKGKLILYGCGLADEIDVKRGRHDLVVNITTPYCPITTDGKEPDFTPFEEEIASAIKRAVGRARRAMPKAASGSERLTQKAIVLDRLNEGVAKASGDGAFRFNQRQLFYVLRPFIIDALGIEPSWENFCAIITDYESEHGDIEGMYRDPRGTLYHPHVGEDISLGTLAVEQYERPGWTFNKVLYIEKEGFFEALKASRWPERHDCALLTSKGYSTRAVRDLLDLLGDSEEPLTVFCVHDADAFGTMIFETLQEETKARPRRRVEVVNLGLEPWEAIEMELATEKVKDRTRRAPVAKYVLAEDGEDWADWLQENRVELNAMPTPVFLAWLDAKMQEQGGQKIIPPAAVVADAAVNRIAEHMRQIITERVLQDARIDDQVTEALQAVKAPAGAALSAELAPWLAANPEQHWTGYVDAIARNIAAGGSE